MGTRTTHQPHRKKPAPLVAVEADEDSRAFKAARQKVLNHLDGRGVFEDPLDKPTQVKFAGFILRLSVAFSDNSKGRYVDLALRKILRNYGRRRDRIEAKRRDVVRALRSLGQYLQKVEGDSLMEEHRAFIGYVDRATFVDVDGDGDRVPVGPFPDNPETVIAAADEVLADADRYEMMRVSGSSLVISEAEQILAKSDVSETRKQALVSVTGALVAWLSSNTTLLPDEVYRRTAIVLRRVFGDSIRKWGRTVERTVERSEATIRSRWRRFEAARKTR